MAAQCPKRVECTVALYRVLPLERVAINTFSLVVESTTLYNSTCSPPTFWPCCTFHADEKQTFAFAYSTSHPLGSHWYIFLRLSWRLVASCRSQFSFDPSAASRRGAVPTSRRRVGSASHSSLASLRCPAIHRRARALTSLTSSNAHESASRLSRRV